MKGFIYKLISPSHQELVYYGSTITSLSIRFSQHKSNYRTKSNKTTTANTIVCYDDCVIELVEEIEYIDTKELRKREGYYINNFECVNKKIAGRTWAEYSKEYHKLYREGEKRNDLLQKKKEYHEKNKEILNRKRREKRANELKILNHHQHTTTHNVQSSLFQETI
jgi:hypothetical protein